MSLGLKTKSGRILQIIHQGADPNLFDPNGKRVVCSNFEEYVFDEAPEYQHLKRQGAKARVGNVLLEEVSTGTAKGPIYYNLFDDQILPFWLGAASSDTTNNGVRATEYKRPQFQRADRKFFSVQEGLLDNCELGCYGMITSFKWTSKRGNKGQSEFDLGFVTQAKVPFGAMTGGVARNSKFRVAAANVQGDLVLNYLLPGATVAKQVTLSIGDTAPQTKAKFEANGDGVNVSIAGAIVAGDGERHHVVGSGNALSIYGVAVDFTAADPKSSLQTAIRALQGRGSAVVSGTITKSVAGQFVISGAGTVAVNGIYSDFGPGVDAGTREFRSASGFRLYRSGGQWVLRASDNGDRYYQTSGTPVSAYPVLQEALNAALPVPTVSGTGNATPASLNIDITYDANAGNLVDVEAVPGPGYAGTSTQPGAAGGTVVIEFTAPANARVQLNRVSGDAGYVLSETQPGSNGDLLTSMVDPKPVTPGHIELFSAPTLAGALLPAARAGRVCEWELNDSKIVSPQSHHIKISDPARPTLGTTYDSHGEEETESDSLQLMITMDCDETGEVPALLAEGRRYVSGARWWHLVATCPEAPYKIVVDFYGSLGTSVPRKFAGNIEQRMFPIDLLENEVEGFNFRVTTYRPA